MLEKMIPYGNLSSPNHEIMCSVAQVCRDFADFKQNIMQNVQTNYNEQLKTIINTTSNETMNNYVNIMQDKQKIIINDIANTITNIKTEQQTLSTDIGNLVKKMGGSSNKGKISEQTVGQILYNLFPTAEIREIGAREKESGDILLYRKNKHPVMIENKMYSRNVNEAEVEKFLRDATKLNISAIMLSQEYGIAHKDNYQIDIIQNNVFIYVHNVNHEEYKIKIAIDIIDNIKKQLDSMDNEKNINMNEETLQEINKEYNQFIQAKISQLKLLEEYNKNMKKYIEDLQVPSLEKYLTDAGCTRIVFKEYICKYCDKKLPSEKGLTNHTRACTKKKLFLEQNTNQN